MLISDNPQLTVTVVLYQNDRAMLLRMLTSLEQSTLPLKLFLVDNSPSPIFDENELNSTISYICPDTNLGFGKAHNRVISELITMRKCVNAKMRKFEFKEGISAQNKEGVRNSNAEDMGSGALNFELSTSNFQLRNEKSISDGDCHLSNSKYHLILNPDTSFGPEVLEQMVTYMDANSDIGLLSPLIRYPNGDIQYLCKQLPTPMDLIIRRFIPLKKWKERRNYQYEMRDTGYDRIMDVPSLSGCFMLTRLDVLAEIGGFDERFFMYLEDLDLCRRIGEVSRTVFYPEVEIVHEYTRGSRREVRLLWHHVVSALKYFWKWRAH